MSLLGILGADAARKDSAERISWQLTGCLCLQSVRGEIPRISASSVQ